MIRVTQLVKRAGARQLLAIEGLLIEPSAVTAVIGPTGAGKTTLLRCLSLVDAPDAGMIEMFGQSFHFPDSGRANAQSEQPWPKLTAVFQDLWLWDHLTLRANIRLPTQRNVGRAADARFGALVAELDIAHLVDRYPHQVSGGERQRAAIARGIMQEPSILLLDEPTSASDVEHSYKLSAVLRRLALQGTTIVLVTHHLGFAQRVSDQVIFLDEGVVLQSGPVDLLRHPTDERVKRFVSVL